VYSSHFLLSFPNLCFLLISGSMSILSFALSQNNILATKKTISLEFLKAISFPKAFPPTVMAATIPLSIILNTAVLILS